MGRLSKLRPSRRVLEAAKPKAELVKKSVCSASFLVAAIWTGVLILFYYTFSISLTFYNKRIMKVFKFPLSITLLHLTFKFMCAGVIRSILECRSKEERVTLSWSENVKRIAPTGIVSALDIGLSNWSFEFITISLYTMSKSTAILFILGFSLLFKLEKFRVSLVFIVAFVSGGLLLFTYHSTEFNLEGFILVMTASFLSGLRWTLAQLVTQKKEIGLSNPLDMMYHIQPWMILGLLPLATVFEGLDLSTTNHFFRCEDLLVFVQNIAILAAGAVLAFLLEFSEFLLLSRTSSLTLSISGVVKEVCTLYLAHTINGDKMNSINVLGLVICLFGIILHVILKAVYKKSESSSRSLERVPESVEMLTSDGGANLGYEEDEEADEVDVFNIKRDR